jgi:hypothetical protein
MLRKTALVSKQLKRSLSRSGYSSGPSSTKGTRAYVYV